MAKSQRVSEATVRRIWKQHTLRPHSLSTFELSRDPRFAQKLIDVVGLCPNPPDKAMVLCVDEKSQIQTLDRTQLIRAINDYIDNHNRIRESSCGVPHVGRILTKVANVKKLVRSTLV
jgi:hypothetical protein